MEYINKYTITSSLSLPSNDISSWRISGSKDGNSFIQLDYRSGISFGGRGLTKEFYLRNNIDNYYMIKFDILNNRGGNTTHFSEMNFYSCKYEPMSSFQYEYSAYTYLYGEESIYIAPISSGYYPLSISPYPLPAGITFNGNSGEIKGTSTAFLGSKTFSITTYDSIPQVVSITITIQNCPLTTFPITIYKHNQLKGDQEHISIYTSLNQLIYASTGYLNTPLQQNTFCITPGSYYLVLEDDGIDGWDTSSYVELYIKQSNIPILLLSAHLYETTIQNITFTTIFDIVPNITLWTHYQSSTEIPINWNTISFIEDISWKYYLYSLLSKYNFHLFRYIYVFNSSSSIQGFEISIYSNSGIYMYINGNLYYSENVNINTFSINSYVLNITSPLWYTITLPINLFSNGNNIISIAFIHKLSSSSSSTNINNNLPNPVFNVYMRSLYESISIPRSSSLYMSITDTHHRQDSESSIYLFDYDSTTNWVSVQSTKDTIQSVTMSFSKGHKEYINYMCIRNNIDNNNYDPLSILFYGFNSINETASLLLVKNTISWRSRSQEQCFFMNNHLNAYNSYRLSLYTTTYSSTSTTSSTILQNSYFSLSELKLFLININTIQIPSFTITPTSIESYIHTYFPILNCPYSYYSNFQINPQLPSFLSMDSETGIITGIPNVSIPTQSYTITALSIKGDLVSTTILITILECNIPNVLFTLQFSLSDSTDSTKYSYELYNGLGTQLIGERNYFPTYSTTYISYCVSSNVYQLILYDHTNKGWGSSYYRILLEDDSVYTQGTLSRGESPKTIYINFSKPIHPSLQQWKYFNYGYKPDSNWYTINYPDTNWNSYSQGNLPNPYGITQYYRGLFTIENIDLYASYNIQLYLYGGVIIYINGYEIYRYNLPDGILSYSIFANSEYIPGHYIYTSGSSQISTLIEGINTIAIEIHQGSISNTTYIFDCSLSLQIPHIYKIIDGISSSNRYNSYQDENYPKAFDNNIDTKYFNSLGCQDTYIQWTYNNDRREYINSYSITVGNNCHNRHPSGWSLKASNDEKSWILLDEQLYIQWTSYKQTKTFNFFSIQAYNIYQLYIISCQSHIDIQQCGAGGIQLAEFQLWTEKLSDYCSPIPPFPGALYNSYSIISCPYLYSGTIRRYCNSTGIFEEEEYLCEPLPPSVFYYPQNAYGFITNNEITPIIPQFIGENVTFTVIPDLPKDLILNITTGIITGIIREELTLSSYIIKIMNSKGYLTFILVFTSTHLRCSPEGIWESTPVGNTITQACANDNYQGYQSRACLNTIPASWDNVEDHCIMKQPWNITYSHNYYIFYKDDYVSPLIPTYKGIILQWSISPSLPSSLSYESTNGYIFGMPSISSPPILYTILASNTHNSTSISITIEIRIKTCPKDYSWPETERGLIQTQPCSDSINYTGFLQRICIYSNTPHWGDIQDLCYQKPPSNITYSQSFYLFYKTQEIHILPPTYSGIVTQWNIFPPLPLEISIDTKTGEIYSKSALSLSTVTYTIQANNLHSSSYTILTLSIILSNCTTLGKWNTIYQGQTLSIPCDDPLTFQGVQTRACLDIYPPSWGSITSSCVYLPPYNVSYPISLFSLIKGNYYNSTSINYNGYVSSFSIVPQLPEGLSFNSTNGIISGTPLESLAGRQYYITAENPSGVSIIHIYIEITALYCIADGLWSTTERGNTIYLPCTDTINYNGNIQRTCIFHDIPIWSPILNTCIKKSPWDINYNSSSISIYRYDTYIGERPTYKGIIESWSITPSLPRGLLLDIDTGRIYGTPIDIHKNIYIITASNSDSSYTVVLEIEVFPRECGTMDIWNSLERGLTVYKWCNEVINNNVYTANNKDVGIIYRKCGENNTDNNPLWSPINREKCVTVTDAPSTTDVFLDFSVQISNLSYNIYTPSFYNQYIQLYVTCLSSYDITFQDVFVISATNTTSSLTVHSTSNMIAVNSSMYLMMRVISGSQHSNHLSTYLYNYITAGNLTRDIHTIYPYQSYSIQLYSSISVLSSSPVLSTAAFYTMLILFICITMFIIVLVTWCCYVRCKGTCKKKGHRNIEKHGDPNNVPKKSASSPSSRTRVVRI
ncbi:hypothetical protein WA158_006887 [Blastocystis sp. Blastoise]